MKNLLLVLLTLSLLLPLEASAQTTCEATGGAHCYYAVSGGSGTACSYASPCSLEQGLDNLSAGDYLYLLDTGGDFPENEIPASIVLTGTSDNPIKIKNYTDQEPVLFQRATYPANCARRDMITISQSSYVIFEGITFKHDCYIDCGGTTDCNPVRGKYKTMLGINHSDHITFSDNEIAGSTNYRTMHGFDVISSDYVTINNNYLHDFTPASGDQGGDGSDRSQGQGWGIYAFDSDFLLIKENHLERCNHDCISIVSGEAGSINQPCKYAKVVNNFVNSQYGGGIYVGLLSAGSQYDMYSLIEGNVLVNAGGTTSKSKGGLFVTGSRISIRKNVFYNPRGDGLSLEANDFYSANDNLVYNNTVFGSGQGYNDDPSEDGGYDLYVLVKVCDPACSVENNILANNIFYRSSFKNAWISGGSYSYKPELLMYLEEANSDNGWYNPDRSINWGNNLFRHNLIRKNEEAGETYSDLITYGGPGDTTLFTTFNIREIENEYPGFWHDNIGADPGLTSEDPEDHGLAKGWWSIQENSPVVNKGEVVDDTIGWEVESQYPGWGWGNLKYSGSAPDIGAFEFGIDDPAGLPNVEDDDPQDVDRHVHAGGCNVSASASGAHTLFLALLLFFSFLVLAYKRA